MMQCLVHIHPLLWIFVKEIQDEIFGVLTDNGGGWECHFRQFAFVIAGNRHLLYFALEGRFPEQQFISHYSQTPRIYLFSVAFV